MNTNSRRLPAVLLAVAILEAVIIAGGCVFFLTRKPQPQVPWQPFAEFQAEQVESVRVVFGHPINYSPYDLSREEIKEPVKALQWMYFFCEMDPSYYSQQPRTGGKAPDFQIKLTDGTEFTLCSCSDHVHLNSKIYAVDSEYSLAVSWFEDSCIEKAGALVGDDTWAKP